LVLHVQAHQFRDHLIMNALSPLQALEDNPVSLCCVIRHYTPHRQVTFARVKHDATFQAQRTSIHNPTMPNPHFRFSQRPFF